MIYIVTGIYRSGTSMMMHALHMGGLDVEYTHEKNTNLKEYIKGNYHPNKHGLYEFYKKEYEQPDFPRMYDGKLIKVPYHSLGRICSMPDGIRMVFMRRDPDEIDASIKLMLGEPRETLDEFAASTPRTIRRLRRRRDMISFHEFWFHEVVDNPLKHFQILKDAGWEIAPRVCASIPKKKYVHIHKEDI